MQQFAVLAHTDYRDGKIEIAKRISSRSAQPVYKALPKGRAPSQYLALEADAKRWIDECQVGGNLQGFMEELLERKRPKRKRWG